MDVFLHNFTMNTPEYVKKQFGGGYPKSIHVVQASARRKQLFKKDKTLHTDPPLYPLLIKPLFLGLNGN